MHYRDDRHALEARRDDLRQELADLGKKAEELRVAVHDHEAVQRELAALEARLAHIEARRASLLENVRIASPCTASWDAMTGDDRVRFCGQCQKNVYNLSAMPRDEAERLLAERDGAMCVRLYRRTDGTVLTADCPVGVRKKRVRLALFGAASAGVMAAATAWRAYTCTMGDIGPGQYVAGGIQPLPPRESFVPMTLAAKPEPGLALVFWTEHPGARQTWRLYADGTLTREDAGSAPVRLPIADGERRGEEVLRLLNELTPEAFGIVAAYADNLIHQGIEIRGSGTRPATDEDRARLAELARNIAR
ncbi:hypothetical protein A7982_13188 [Minicystis rosea]|nr:hypothetical protein A7982_13188 [Minicystis rosea]